MHTPLRSFSLSASAIAVALLASACGGGDAEPPPDIDAPTVAITDDVSGATATAAVTFTFTFSEDVGSSFVAEDVLVSGGTAGTLVKVSDTVYTLAVTPPEDSDGTIAVSVAAAKFRDIANNDNTAEASATQASDTRVVTPPAGGTVVVSFDEDPPVNLGAFGDASPSIAAAPEGGTGAALKLDRSGNVNFGGTYFALPTAVPFAANRKTFTARVYATRANANVFLKVEVPGGAATEVMATTGAANTWQTLTWVLEGVDPASSYTTMVFSADTDVASLGAQTYWIDEVTLADAPAGGGGTATAVVSFDEDPPVELGAFGDAGPSIAAAPEGGTGSALKLDRTGGVNFGGTYFTLPAAVPFAADRKTLTARVYATRANANIFLKVEVPGGAATEVMATTGAANTWQTLTWVMEGVNPASSYTTMVFSADTDVANLGAQTYWIDEVALEAGTGDGGGGGGFAGVFAANYVGDLFVNAQTAQGGDVGVFFDGRLPAVAAYDYAGVAGEAQNPGGVPNFYQGFGLTGAPITDAYYGAFVKAPGNGAVDVSGYSNLKVRVWGPDQLFQAGTFPILRVVLQTPAVAGCGSNSGGSEVTASFQTTTQGAASEYTLPLSGFTVQFACSGESLAQILASIAQVNILLEGTNIQYLHDQPGDAFGNGLNVGPIRFE
jgi:hypothetical protein